MNDESDDILEGPCQHKGRWDTKLTHTAEKGQLSIEIHQVTATANWRERDEQEQSCTEYDQALVRKTQRRGGLTIQ